MKYKLIQQHITNLNPDAKGNDVSVNFDFEKKNPSTIIFNLKVVVGNEKTNDFRFYTGMEYECELTEEEECFDEENLINAFIETIIEPFVMSITQIDQQIILANEFNNEYDKEDELEEEKEITFS